MIVGVSLFALLTYTFVVSQPLFFAFALGRASLALSGPSYAELRQRINAAIMKPLLAVYAVTFVACVALAVLAASLGSRTTAVGAAVGGLLLVVDLGIAVKKNVPLNAIMNAWDPAALPADWSATRDAWHRAFAVRQVVLGVGYVALVVGLFVQS